MEKHPLSKAPIYAIQTQIQQAPIEKMNVVESTQYHEDTPCNHSQPCMASSRNEISKQTLLKSQMQNPPQSPTQSSMIFPMHSPVQNPAQSLIESPIQISDQNITSCPAQIPIQIPVKS
jgi:hypothetical protein